MLAVRDAVLGLLHSPRSVPVLRTMQGEDTDDAGGLEGLEHRGDDRAVAVALIDAVPFGDCRLLSSGQDPPVGAAPGPPGH